MALLKDTDPPIVGKHFSPVSPPVPRCRALSPLSGFYSSFKKDFLLPESSPPQLSEMVLLPLSKSERTHHAPHTHHMANCGPLGPQTLLPASPSQTSGRPCCFFSLTHPTLVHLFPALPPPMSEPLRTKCPFLSPPRARPESWPHSLQN